LTNNKITDSHIYSCVNCGNCRLSCPANICPDILYKYATEKNEIDSIYSDNKENFGNFLADSENFQYVDFTLYEEENGFSNKKVIKE
jgi:Fe-S oxidoreductase